MDWRYEHLHDETNYPNAEIGDIGASFHVHQAIEYLLVISGELFIDLGTKNGKSLLLKPGHGIIVCSGALHATKSYNAKFYVAVSHTADLDYALRPPIGATFTRDFYDKEGTVDILFSKMVRYTHTPDNLRFKREVLKSLINTATAIMLPEIMDSAEELGGHGEKSEIITCLYKNYLEPGISAESIAKTIGYSKRCVEMSVKESVGRTVKEYITELRISDAKLLLRSTDDNVESIGFSVGFASTRTFFRVFREKVGMTPGEYRESKG